MDAAMRLLADPAEAFAQYGWYLVGAAVVYFYVLRPYVDGEVALIDSQNYLASGCAKATDNEYVQGDWADPPGVVANPIFRPKFWFKVVVHHTNIVDGPVANFTIRPPPASSAFTTPTSPFRAAA